jgi:predicted Rossmann fold nucleotide-binding protein DprA/Smf involved in DNA uptake
LAALYLRGAPRAVDPSRRHWSQVEGLIRASACSLGSAARVLREAGLIEEAAALATPGLLTWVEGRAARVLTPMGTAYPSAWRSRLGDLAPPALWRRGELPEGRLIGIVGSREVGRAEAAFARVCGSTAAKAGFGVVSGGAQGCDTFGARGAQSVDGLVMRLLPCGLDQTRRPEPGDLSLAPPGEPFSSPLAMERNALIYAAAEATVVVHARFRQGGTWHGAADALRRRLGPILIREMPEDRAFRALVALGARPLAKPEDLEDALNAPVLQPDMFSGLPG